VGDKVEIYLPPGKAITAGFIALLVPILLFPVGYYLPTLITQSAGEGIKIISGLIGIGIGFLISRLFSKAKSKEYTPEVTRVVHED
jgi:sigma-E factor negative regulatory protein RseC